MEKTKTKIFVIKISGKVQNEFLLLDSLLDQLKNNISAANFILMHGGGIQITKYYKMLGVEPVFIDGLRYTSDDEISIVEMVLSGLVNKDITSLMLSKGVNAVGISGRDGIIVAERVEKLGNVGKVVSVDNSFINNLIQLGIMPIISPVSNSKEFKALNINADDAAEAVASSIKADGLVFVSDVPGILDSNKSVINQITKEQSEALISENVIKDGMAVKVRSSFNAIEKGVKNIIITSIYDSLISDIVNGVNSEKNTRLY